MAGINFLYEEYKKDPSRVEKLLDGKIEISEKLDGSRFSVQAQEGSGLLYYKRRDILISSIDRTLSKYYEKAVSHFETLDEDTLEQMPDGWRFGMEYFPNMKPVTIAYDRLPLNNLVLTDIQVKDPKDKTHAVITDKDTLKKWADILQVESPPIFFEGELSESQRRRILDFLNTPYSDLIKRFKTESFTSFILKLLNPEMKASFMNSDINKDIDGLVFRFDGKESFRISNPEITLQKQSPREDKPSDIYNLTLVFLQEFLISLDFKKIKLREKTFEERYIEFICDVYNKFLQTSQYKQNFSGEVNFELPHFLTREESGVNFKFVKNQETLRHLEESNTNRELFKILLASMRSHKKKPSGFFSKELIAHHNKLVDDIADYIASNLKESSFFTFEEFRNVYLSESDNWQQEFGKETIDEIERIDFPTYEELNEQLTKTDENLENLQRESIGELAPANKALDVLRKLYDDSEEPKKKKKTNKVCLLKGKFHPFHNGHFSVATDAAADTGMKVLLAVTTKRLPETKMERELHTKLLDEVIKDHPDIAGYVFTDGISLTQIGKDLPQNTEIGALAGSKEECEDANLQMGPDFKTHTTTKHLNSSSILQKLKDDDYDGYKKLVPKSIHNYFYKIKNELDVK